MKTIGALVLGITIGWLYVPSTVSAAEEPALNRIAAILDKLLDTVKDRNRDRVECVCRCER
jgi:hypothetical protein